VANKAKVSNQGMIMVTKDKIIKPIRAEAYVNE
jgi:hypothetical protein